MSNQLLNFNDLNTQGSNVTYGTDGNDVIVTDFEGFAEDMSGMADEIIDSVETSMSEAGMVDGTAGNDNLTGTFVSGLEGNDTLVGNGSDNMLVGDEGNDLLRSGGTSNFFDGGTGNDTIYAEGTSNFISSGDDGNDNDTIWLNGGDNAVDLIAGSGHDVINNFEVGSTKLFVENIDQLSFVGSADGTQIMQGDDLLAVATDVSADVFTQNKDAIFETPESFTM
jgi:Ca2+-binding RTX toxin-like protein